MNANQALYPIREVSRLTGVNAITLRAWERRYGLIEPVRTESGHRLYTDEHVDAIRRAVELSQQGVPISQVKALLEQQEANEQLSQMAEFEELESRLKAALQAVHLSALQDALDALFIEVDESGVLRLLARFELLPKEPEQRMIWETALLPRLYSRLRFAQKRQADERQIKTVWIAESSQFHSSVAKALTSLWILQQGMQPLLASVEPLPQVKQLKALKCAGVVFLAQASLSEFAAVEHCISLPCLALLMQPSADESPAAVSLETLWFGELFAFKPLWSV